MRRLQQGFTLLEMLVVMVIVGVLSALIFVNYARQVQQARLQSAVTSFSTDLEKARSAAWKSGQSVTISVLATKKGYTYTVNSAPPQVQTMTLPDGITFSAVATATYTPPFADVDASSNIFTLVSPNVSLTDDVRVIGVTGKVIR